MKVFDESYLPSWLGAEYIWVGEIFVVVLATLIIALVASRFMRSLELRSAKTKNHWDDAFFHSVRQPLRWVIWISGLSYAAEVAAAEANVSLVSLLPGLRHVSTIIIFTWFLIGFVSRVEKSWIAQPQEDGGVDPTTAMAFGKLIRISLLITSALVVMQSLGYSVSGVLAFGGIGGIAVGFAAKDLLANFFGGLMIYLDRPFAVGDWVKSPDKEIEGTVEDIGWRLTRIRTFDKRPLYVPNSTFTQISVENPSRMSHRRIYETIGIRYSDAVKMSQIISDVKSMIESHDDLDTTQTIIVNFNKFSSSSLDFFIYCFTKTTNWIEFHRIKQDVLLQVIGIVENNGAQCAFPTSTVHMPDPITLNSEAPDHKALASGQNGD